VEPGQPSREDAAVPGAALTCSRGRAAGLGSHLRTGLGDLAVAVRLAARSHLPDGGDRLYCVYQSTVLLFFENYTGVQVLLYGDLPKNKETMIYLAKHQSTVDWWLLISWPSGRMPAVTCAEGWVGVASAVRLLLCSAWRNLCKAKCHI
jgi:hypothetical protein